MEAFLPSQPFARGQKLLETEIFLNQTEEYCSLTYIIKRKRSKIKVLKR